jgi:hypothetical protein
MYIIEFEIGNKYLLTYLLMTPDSLFHLAVEDTTRGHSMKIQKPRCKTALGQHFFSLRVIEKWNSLPEEAVTAPPLSAFKGN